MAAIARANAEAQAVLSAQEKEDRDLRLSCRFFEHEFPEVEQPVMVKVESIADMGAYVTLLEYNNIEGMILLSELSRRRIRSINKLIRVGKMEVAIVMRVDKEKGYIDLSKRRVTQEDIIKCEETYNKGKACHSIMRHVAETTNSSVLDLNTKIAWPLAHTYGNTFQAFRAAIADSDKVFGGLDVQPNVLAAILSNIRRKLTPQPIKIRADIEVTCFKYEGVDAIRAALQAGEAVGTEECPVKIKLIAPPLYVMLTTTLEKQPGIDLLEKAIVAVTAAITVSKGTCATKIAPRATSQLEDHALATLMEKMELENREIDGDEVDDE